MGDPLAIRKRTPRTGNKHLANFTAEWYAAKLKEQGGACPICGCTPRAFVVDHCHEDGELRGLLCQQCNSGIGMLRDSPKIVSAALKYLKQYGDAMAMRNFKPANGDGCKSLEMF